MSENANIEEILDGEIFFKNDIPDLVQFKGFWPILAYFDLFLTCFWHEFGRFLVHYCRKVYFGELQ